MADVSRTAEVVARSDAEFDGRDFDKLGRSDRDRYLARAIQGIQRVAAFPINGEFTTVLHVQDVEALLDAIENPPEPTPALRKLMADYYRNQRNGWLSMAGAPRDGTRILVYRDNGCGTDYAVVWFSDTHCGYPWRADENAYPEDRFDGWRPLPAAPSPQGDAP